MSEEDVLGVQAIHEQMESSPYYPYNLQSGWLPEPGSASMTEFFRLILSNSSRRTHLV
jgi:hypothetical protein